MFIKIFAPKAACASAVIVIGEPSSGVVPSALNAVTVKFCVPTVAPSVQFTDTFPSASDTPEAADTEPSVVAKLTVAPAK